MNPIANDILAHVGVSKLDGAPIGSGRYPLGSGEDPFQRPKNLSDRVSALRRDGVSEAEIAQFLGYKSTTELRKAIKVEKEQAEIASYAQIRELREKGITSPTEIGRRMGIPESTVRSLIATEEKRLKSSAHVTAEYLKEIVDNKGMVDVGDGVEAELHISHEKLESALEILKMEGYHVYDGRFQQVTDKTGNHSTTQHILTTPEHQHKDIFDVDKIGTVDDYDKILVNNGNDIYKAFEYPASMDSSRLKIRYAGEQGGELKDGIIEIRPGVQDLSLGDARYAQVRILVDGTHYLKGMAVYGDPKEMPDGVDVIFNTNKKEGTPALGNDKNNTVLKQIDSNPDNPFGSTIKEREKGGQSYYDDPNGKFVNSEGVRQSLSLINKRADQDDWNDWKDTLATQFLSKQPQETIIKQIELSKADKIAEYEEILAYTNPTVKRKLLQEFASKCDGNAVDLKAAAFPGQKYKVILPVNSQKDTEIFAPDYLDGTEVALVRYPHAGLFEIPILKVNNKNAEGMRMIGMDTRSAVGITSNTAKILSGADFDGDTVMVIPLSDKVKIQNQPRTGAFAELSDFDPNQYKHEGDYPRLSKGATQQEMGQISNLITDMQLGGAKPEEIVRAVKHSMVIIDATKHDLDYKQSARDNDIAELKKTYQGRIENGKYTQGAATLISAAKSDYQAPKSIGSPRINQKGKPWYDPNRPEGALIYKENPDRFYTDPKTGKIKERHRPSKKMAETDDAYTLVSPRRTKKELIYADYANFLKNLANQARLEMLRTGSITYSAAAKNAYKDEVDSLDAQLKLAKMNRPRERAAQRLAISRVQAKKKAYEAQGLTKQEYKSLIDKERQRALTDARLVVGAKRKPIIFTDKEWKAVQAGAISDSKLTELLKYADMNNVKSYALPRRSSELTVAQKNKIKAMKASGYSIAAIAEAVGCSKSSVSKYM